MPGASALVRHNLTSNRIEGRAESAGSSRLTHAASAGMMALVLTAPFEALHPLVRVPGQSLTTVETVLLCVLALCGGTVAATRERASLCAKDLLPWALFTIAGFASAALAPEFRGNALHMAARIALAAAVWAICVIGAEFEPARRRAVVTAVVSGAIVSILVLADFLGVPGVARFLSLFRSSVAVVGAQVRASGPFQYPTIASMYLEIVFALGLGLLVSLDRTAVWIRGAVMAVLVVVAEAIVLTFTRAGLITMTLSLAIVGIFHWRARGVDHGMRAVIVLGAIIAVQLLSSRPAEMLRLRLTTEGQGNWFSAVIDGPSSITLDTMTPIDVPVTVTNTGRATWDSDAAEPIRLSYHWVADDSDEVIAWEGTRTSFAEPIRPGQTVSVMARVGGPGRPGRFRLMWDLEQEHRLWFSTEPDAIIAFASGVVTGPVRSTGAGAGPRRIPRMSVRPSRFTLWGAALRMFRERPLLGVGPDNYRLLYGRYSTLKVADPRVHSNNMYLEVLAGMGLTGGLALLFLGATSGRAAMRAGRAGGLGLGIAAAGVAIAAHGLVDSFLAFTGTYILFAFTLGLASACERDSRRHAHSV